MRQDLRLVFAYAAGVVQVRLAVDDGRSDLTSQTIAVTVPE